MKKTMKDLPTTVQPYERYETYGPSFLTDAELLAIIIHTGTKEKSALDLAIDLLSIGSNSILNLCDISFEDMKKIKGIGRIKAIQLKSVAELTKRIAHTQIRKKLVLYDAQAIASYYMEDLRHLREEHLLAAFFDSKCAFLGDFKLAIGGVNFANFSPREVFHIAIEKNAVYFVLIHNHPSGDPVPSENDILSTNRMKDCGNMMGISLADHVVIGDLSYYSFRQNNLL